MRVEFYDTTLRDGAQSEDIAFSLNDKFRITEKLDDFGMHFIEGGWPGSNPKDLLVFQRCEEASPQKLENCGLQQYHEASFETR